jgi:hypothetical protein
MAIGRRSAIVVGDLLLLFVVLDVVVVVGFFQSQKTKEVDQTFFPFVTGRDFLLLHVAIVERGRTNSRDSTKNE